MSVEKKADHMVNDYKIGEGDAIGYLPSEFGEGNSIIEQKLVAGEDVKKGQVVEVTDAMEVKPTTAASANVLGVAMFDAKKGSPVSVETEGLFKLVAASAITAPAHVTSAADGKVATVTTQASTTDPSIGLAITDASTDGYIFVKFSI